MAATRATPSLRGLMDTRHWPGTTRTVHVAMPALARHDPRRIARPERAATPWVVPTAAAVLAMITCFASVHPTAPSRGAEVAT